MKENNDEIMYSTLEQQLEKLKSQKLIIANEEYAKSKSLKNKNHEIFA